MIQAEDRTHRMGQVNPVTIYYIYWQDTIDEMVFQLLASKNQVMKEVLD